MPADPKSLSISNLAKYGHFDELVRRHAAGEPVDQVTVFERAVADFRTIKRNSGHAAMLEWCVEQGVDLEARAGWLNQGLVSLAAANGNNAIVEAMRRRGLPESPFVWSSLGEVERLAAYAASHDLSAVVDANGFNLLFHCAESRLGLSNKELSGRLAETCRLLLASGVDPRCDLAFDLPITPLFLCASSGGNEEIMQMLLGTGGATPEQLFLAIEHALEPHQRSGPPFYGIAGQVLRHGFDVNQLVGGRTLLHGAANRGSIEAVRWLLAQGANPNLPDSERRTALHRAAERNTATSVVKPARRSRRRCAEARCEWEESIRGRPGQWAGTSGTVFRECVISCADEPSFRSNTCLYGSRS